MTVFQRCVALFGGVVCLGLFAILLYMSQGIDGVVELTKTSSEEEWKTLLILLSRLAMFPLFGCALILDGLQVWQGFARKLYILGALSLLLNIIFTVVVTVT